MKKVALVTGASSGIGKATAKQFLKDGYIVYAAARRENEMKDIEGLGARIIKMDVSDDASMTEGIQKIIREAGKIDILVNNAGYALHGAVEDVPIKDARMQMAVNLFGPARLIQLSLPHMRKNGYGKIVNVSSVAGRMYSPANGWYFASKHALEGFSDCLRLEVAPFHIDVIIIEPGVIRTAISDVTAARFTRYSEGGAYNKMTKLAKDVFANIQKYGSKPDVVARAISRAVKAKKPRTRYATGRFAKIVLMSFKLLPDKLFDFVYTKLYLKKIGKMGNQCFPKICCPMRRRRSG